MTTNKTNRQIPELFQNIIALLKFDDVGCIAAIGYAVKVEDDPNMIVFVSKLSRTAYPFDMVVKWKYLRDVAQEFEIGF